MEFATDLLADLPTLIQIERIVVRLLAAALLAAVIGAQRELAGKSAGLKTHMLVALGTAFFVLAAQESGLDREEMSRVIQGVATGVGFIGAGAILKIAEREEIHGLTTAASLWLTAAVGVAVGLGRIGSAAIAVLIGWIILSVFGRISVVLARRNPRRPHDEA